jgi:hypothetical protein
MNGVTQTMFNCIKCEICGRTEEIVLPEVSMRFFIDLFRLSKKHDIAPIVGDALNKCGAFEHLPVDIEESEREAIAKIKTKFDEQIFTAVYRYENINNELKEIRRVLSEAKIPFIPLKGSVIREYYPEPWQRTSCDIDVLVKEKDADKASKVLAERLQYKINEKGQHDVSLFSPSNIHVELHFKLMDIEFKQVSVLRDIWNGGEITPVSGYEYRMSKELFLLYHIYHMAKHFVHGGCGIKPFIDLWIIKNKIGFDGGKAQKMLQESGLLAFYERSIDLMSVWFEGKPHNSVTQEMEDYILQGGVYGTLEQQLAMSQNKKGGKFRHLLSKIFLSYEQMKVYYPSVKKCPILFPFYQVRRWFRILFCGGRKAAMNEIKLNQSLSEEKKQAAKNLIDELGL